MEPLRRRDRHPLDRNARFRRRGGQRIPAEFASVELIEAESDKLLSEIAIGESFRVRLTYAEDPDEEITETVTITLTSGDVIDVEVTDGSRVLLSAPIEVVPLVQP